MTDSARWNHLRDVSGPMKDLLVMFPPLCRVIACRHLHVPSPGQVGRVVQYFDRGPDSSLLVQDEDVLLKEGRLHEGARECFPEWLLLVQYDGNKTREWVRQVLSGETMFSEDPILRGRIAGPMTTEDPHMWVLRLDTAQPLQVHPDQIFLDGEGLYLQGGGRRIPVTYAMSIQEVEA